MADPAASDPLAADQPMTLFRRVIALALQGDFDAAIADATAMWQAWLRAGAPPGHWMAPAAYAGVSIYGLRGDSGGVREWRGRAAELAAGRIIRSISLFTAFADSRVALHHGHYDQAAAALAGLGIGERPWHDNTRHWDYDAYAWALAAEAAVAASLPDATQLLAAAAPACPRRTSGPPPASPGPPAGCTTTVPRCKNPWQAGSASDRDSNGPAPCCCYPTSQRKDAPNWTRSTAPRPAPDKAQTGPPGD